MSKVESDVMTARLEEVRGVFPYWQKTLDVIDQFIDLTLNLRQSGHPGGSHSKAPLMVATLLSGVMRWDIRHPEKRFGDRFLLGAGHTVPLAYMTLSVLNESLREMHGRTGDPRYLIPDAENRAVYWEDLLRFRHRGGLAGHAEMEGKTLFLKFNTGPSGHGFPVGAGEAMALKRAGAEEVKVFVMEGEGGLTPGASHETKNSAWGLGLSNLYLLLDWNDFGIDGHRTSSIVHGTPREWFASYGWRVSAALKSEEGDDLEDITRALYEVVFGPNPDGTPGMCYVRTHKGRSYLLYDNKSHGVPHKPMDSETFWETKRPFAEKYGVDFDGFGKPAPEDAAEKTRQTRNNLEQVLDVMRKDEEFVSYLADRLVELGESVPETIPTFRLEVTKNPLHDPKLTDYENYPPEMFIKPGSKAPNRQGLARFGSWINAYCRKHYNRPLFIICSADLADSTNISGFAHDFGDMPGWGKYHRTEHPEGVLLPQAITEFTNSGICVGVATVNLSPDPLNDFDGFYTACSTYGSFVYLKYGPLRLFSQLSQDCQLKVGKVLWVAGHSGPETADDSRTHFGVFAPGVTSLFPRGQICNAHPWEANEVPVVIAAMMKHPAPIMALHLTRPPVEIPDREALGIPSHFAAGRGAYVMRQPRPEKPVRGTVLVEGTATTNNMLKVLPRLEKAGLNVKVVAAISRDLFEIQPADYRRRVLSDEERLDAMAVTNRARQLMGDWLAGSPTLEYWMGSDWDNRWRTGGTVDEVVDEAHLSADHIFEGIERYVKEREGRRRRLRKMLE